MSESKKTKGDLQFILPKEGSSTVSQPKEESSEVTKIIDLTVEDFMGKLNEAVQQQLETFIKSPSFLIGGQTVSVGCWISGNTIFAEVGESDHLKSLKVTGNCGNLAFEDTADDARYDIKRLDVPLGSAWLGI